MKNASWGERPAERTWLSPPSPTIICTYTDRTMLESILIYERDLFFLINHPGNGFLDGFMWLVSQTRIWIPLFAVLLFALVFRNRAGKWLPVLVVIALTFLFCDQFSSGICKPFFARLRPTHHPDFMNEVRTLAGYRGGLHGFISGHAANAFGFATITALLFRNSPFSVSVYLLAVIIAYSRVYLGVHFLSDVLAGAISGIAIGFAMHRIYKLYAGQAYKDTVTLLSPLSASAIAAIVLSYILILFLYGVLTH